MPGDSPITVGPHEYTAQDARQTVARIARLWESHVFSSEIPEGWLAGARGFVAEMASLAGVPLPRLDDLPGAIVALDRSVNAKYADLTEGQVESILAAMWRFYPTMRMLGHEHSGTVAGLHASQGLPKKPIDRADITWAGVDGDVQRVRTHHGRPWQALCIWTTDSLDRLRGEGHPIAAGFAGENITVEGIANTSFRPGAHFRTGSVQGFITNYTTPCAANAGWFLGGDFMRMSHERGDDSRVYAMVTRTGSVSTGDPFVLFTDR